MKLALGIMKFDLSTGNAFEFDVRDPGRPIHTFIEFEQQNLLLPGKPKMNAVPSVVLEVNPSAPPRRRRFLMIPVDTQVDYPGELAFFAAFTNPHTGSIAALYEIVSTDVAALAQADAKTSSLIVEGA